MASQLQARSPHVFLTITLLVLSTGCQEELGPERFATTPVSGSIVEGGRAVGGGWIEFVPVDATVGRICAARIQADGSFLARSVPIGVNLIRLVNAPIQLRGGRQLFGNYSTTPLRRVVRARPGGPVKIDLLEEALLLQSRRSRTGAGRSQESPGGAEP
jgi:hypothetical protein